MLTADFGMLGASWRMLESDYFMLVTSFDMLESKFGRENHVKMILIFSMCFLSVFL